MGSEWFKSISTFHPLAIGAGTATAKGPSSGEQDVEECPVFPLETNEGIKGN